LGTGLAAVRVDGDDELDGHAVCIVGYDKKRNAWKLYNSWGGSVGDKGYYWVTKGALRNVEWIDVLF